MNPHDTQRFEKEWKAWSERPPRTAPATAAARVMARIDDRPRRVERPLVLRPAFGAWLAAAAVLLAVVGVGLFDPPTSETPAADLLADLEAPALGENVALIWLDSETPLYMSLQPPVPDPPAAADQGDTP